MSPRDRFRLASEQVGFTIWEESGVVRAEGVPCLLKGGVSSTCTIEKFYDVETGRLLAMENALHVVKVTPDVELDGRVYLADGNPLGSWINGDEKTWSCISIALDSGMEESARDLVYRYVNQIVGAERQSRSIEGVSPARPSPFNIPNTYESRAGVTQVQDRIRDQSVMILGLGGTGSYLLDLMTKTPVREIHALDGDSMNWHNYMRAAGSPTAKEIKLQHREPPLKVDYYRPKYSPLRKGLELHAIHIESGGTFSDYVAEHPIDFAFVCVDQLRDSDSPRQDVIYRSLSESSIPFIDSGVSIVVEDTVIRGSITTGFYVAGSTEWDRIPNAKVHGDIPGYYNVQLPEINAMAASLAVMEWRRRTGQYLSESTSSVHKFRFEVPKIVARD